MIQCVSMEKILRLLSVAFVVVISSGLSFCRLAESNPGAKLRSSYMDLSVSQVHAIPKIKYQEKKKWGFYGYSTIQHHYEAKTINSDRVVVDHATRLMWHQSGSEKYLQWRRAKKWVAKLNTKGYAGYYDWRLPTLEEAASLLENSPIFNRYIDPVFDNHQPFIWTGDTKKSGFEAWLVSFKAGSVYWLGIIHNRFVRPVRSMK